MPIDDAAIAWRALSGGAGARALIEDVRQGDRSDDANRTGEAARARQIDSQEFC
jgi:hypothetical protein